MIDIKGITIEHQPIDMEDSSDQAHLITIKDEYGNKVYVRIINDKIDGSNKTEEDENFKNRQKYWWR